MSQESDREQVHSSQESRPSIREEIADLHCTADDLRRILGSTPFFRGLDDADLDTVVHAFRQSHFAPGDVIQRAGDPAEWLSIVAAGLVKMARPTPDGQDVLLEILQPGDFFGSLAVLGDETYTDDVTAHTHCCILRASSRSFRQLLERYPPVAMATLAFVSGRLHDAHATIEGLSVRPVDQRVAMTLLKLAHRSGRQQGESMMIDMPLSRQDLADMTGATVETVSRVMSELRRTGVIVSGRRWISISDTHALTLIAEGRRSV